MRTEEREQGRGQGLGWGRLGGQGQKPALFHMRSVLLQNLGQGSAVIWFMFLADLLTAFGDGDTSRQGRLPGDPSGHCGGLETWGYMVAAEMGEVEGWPRERDEE